MIASLLRCAVLLLLCLFADRSGPAHVRTASWGGGGGRQLIFLAGRSRHLLLFCTTAHSYIAAVAREPMNDLHIAAGAGSVERVESLLSQGSIDIDEGSHHNGLTALMCAAIEGRAHIARILVNRGADVSILSDPTAPGYTALIWSAYTGNAVVTRVLISAGADLEVATGNEGGTALHIAAQEGHLEVMEVLIEAGANVDSCGLEVGYCTPLYIAAQEGHANAVRELLRAKANPLIGRKDYTSLEARLPVDVAALKGHLGVVKEMIRQVGIEGCGGASGGVDALTNAANEKHVDILAILTDAGVVDTGEALVQAAGFGIEESVKMLLQQQGGKYTGGDAYANVADPCGRTPLLSCILGCLPCSPKVARTLVDAGADTTRVFRSSKDPGGEIELSSMPVALIDLSLDAKIVGGEKATEQ